MLSHVQCTQRLLPVYERRLRLSTYELVRLRGAPTLCGTRVAVALLEDEEGEDQFPHIARQAALRAVVTPNRRRAATSRSDSASSNPAPSHVGTRAWAWPDSRPDSRLSLSTLGAASTQMCVCVRARVCGGGGGGGGQADCSVYMVFHGRVPRADGWMDDREQLDHDKRVLSCPVLPPPRHTSANRPPRSSCRVRPPPVLLPIAAHATDTPR